MNLYSMELISIIMPAYNCEKYIEESINSVINQSYENWELVIVNDCSKDKTEEIIKKNIEKDKRIKYYNNSKNLGVAETRNKAIDLANGNFIAFLDSDDIWKKNKLKKQMNIIKNNNADMVFTGSEYINENGKAFKGILNVPNKVTYKQLRKNNVISCSSVLIKKKKFEHIKIEGENMHEDYVLWLRILKEGVVAYGINEPLLIYRISKNSKSGNKFKTFRMTYRVFKFVGLNSASSIYFTMSHIIRSLAKYRRIKFGCIFKRQNNVK